MPNSIQILKIYPKSLRVNLYTTKHFRVIGLIDVKVRYSDGFEKVTLAFYRSSGTYDGKIEGLWYPIVGIKTHTGGFTEFTEYLNYVLSKTTNMGSANKGWLAKSLFFIQYNKNSTKVHGFSNGTHYESLLEIGKILRYLYDHNKYQQMNSLDAITLNNIITSSNIYKNNEHTQKENYERLIQDIFEQTK
ncbi:hypothetical protein [Anaeromicropila herbilytica]|uniref:Uncharacterized protein n=1 Tax=Anaeromicropila herbilytica TaxID=2785025 RepID=A0A7R7EJ51_9FIRM|nr:hypothetical protein [Anaeromicropila herbilytica]BCN29387.1 hypothetical protein bsdtb5_06820 [Anaeromicropila herbilytica]